MLVSKPNGTTLFLGNQWHDFKSYLIELQKKFILVRITPKPKTLPYVMQQICKEKKTEIIITGKSTPKTEKEPT